MQLVAQPNETASVSGKISLELGSAKKTFVEGEIIWFDVTVRNLTREPATILMPDQFYYLKVMVQNSKGEMLPRGFIDHMIGPPTTTIIYPDKPRVTSVNLITYGNADQFTGVMKHLQLGDYKAWVRLGDVKSNVIDFKIVDATAEDRIVQDRLKLAHINGIGGREDIAVEEYRALIRESPKTSYWPNVYHDLISFAVYKYLPESPDSMILLTLDVIAKFPNLGIAQHALNNFVKAYQYKLGIVPSQAPSAAQQAVIERRLNDIKASHPGTKLQGYIDERIELSRLWWSRKKVRRQG